MTNFDLLYYKQEFLKSIDGISWRANVWGEEDEEGNVFEYVFEWISDDRTRHAVASIDANGIIGYTMLDTSKKKFIPGCDTYASYKELPKDLKDYLNV